MRYGRVLPDAEANTPTIEKIGQVNSTSLVPVQLYDLHACRGGKGKFACILILSTDNNDALPDYSGQLFSTDEAPVHIGIEINRVGAQKFC